MLHADVAVVGGGLAGLTAAQLLRRAGHDVVVLEPSVPGGRGRADRRGEVVLNRGPRALYLEGPAHRVLRQLDMPLSGGSPSQASFGRRGEQVGALPAALGSLATTPLLGVRGKWALARFMASFPKLRAESVAGMAFGDWLHGRGLPDDAQQLVAMLSRVATYANAPDIAAADMVVAQMQQAMRHGVRYLDGGWQSMVDALLVGLHVERGAVQSVRPDGGLVHIERADGSDVTARACVVAVGTPDAAALLLDRAPFDVGPSVEAACLELATAVPAKPGLLLGVDQPLYLSNHCPPARLAPDGVHVVHVARYLSPDETHEPKDGRAELEAHAAMAGITPDVVIDSRYLHRMTVVGGLAVARLGGLRGRPSADAAGVPGVFLAGDWVGPDGHLLDAVMASAEVAAAGADRVIRDATLTTR